MRVSETALPGVVLIGLDVHEDPRGYFVETWNRGRYEEVGIRGEFVQDNLSCSTGGVVRGLHFQNPHGQAKLVYVLEGEALDVVVDVRLGSPTFGKWVAEVLSAQNRHQLFVPEGFAHGFSVLSESVTFAYKCTEFYSPECERGIRWDDPAIGIDWRVADPILSAKDADLPLLAELPQSALPRYVGE